jgi:hypothetical protein
MDKKKRSGGPRTEAGKARSSQNARKHGLLADKVYLLQNENPVVWEHIKTICYQTFQPKDEFEQRLVDKIACARWRMDRLIATETAIIACKMEEQADEFNGAYGVPDECVRTAVAIQDLADKSNVLALLQRYEGHLERSYTRCVKALFDLRAKLQLPENAAVIDDLPNELEHGHTHEQAATGSVPAEKPINPPMALQQNQELPNEQHASAQPVFNSHRRNEQNYLQHQSTALVDAVDVQLRTCDYGGVGATALGTQ